jgi:biopolymer transport protein ExbD
MNLEMHHKRLSTFSPVSLADVILLLLIFFLLTSTYVLEPGIRVKLPRAYTSDVVSRKDIQVTITTEGRLFLNDREMTLQDFSTELEKLIEESEEKIVIIRADKSVTVDKLVQIMDIGKGVGGEKFLIATRRIG